MFKLIVGLGNPENQYGDTRHNVGFSVVNELKKQVQTISCASKFKVDVGELHQGGQKTFILKPTAYMNESGSPVGEFAKFYKIVPEEILVIHDDLDLPLGNLRLSEGGSSGGHNGVQSVIDNFGANFWRMRVGIGSNKEFGLSAEDYVLQKFKPEEKEVIEKSIIKAAKIVSKIIGNEPTDKIQNEISEYNRGL